ncbi:MAG: glycosyltransferase involved in cell wall biosynthesis, partial [Candidatus Omnitrophota bacterium]
TLKQLVSLFKIIRPDIVHTYLFTSDLYGRIAAKLAGVKVIITAIRNIDAWKKPHHLYVDRLLATITTAFTVNSNNIRPFMTREGKIKNHHITTIHNGVDLKRFENLKTREAFCQEYNIKPEAVIVGMVARFNTQKDHKTFLEVAKKILVQRDDVVFLVVGAGDTREAVEREYYHPNIKFTGLRQDVPDVINAMDIGVLASHYEGFPNVIMEYMACSKPAICSEVGGANELIVDGSTGFLVKPANVIQLLAKLESLIDDRELRQKMGTKGRIRIEENFTSEQLAHNTEILYEQSLETKVGFLLSQFPEMHETFILREFLGFKKADLSFKIYSYKQCKDAIIHPQVNHLIGRTFYAPVFEIVSLLYWLLFRSMALIRSYIKYVLRHIIKPMNFIKANGIFIRSLSIARMMKKHRIQHIHAHWATMPTTGAQIIADLLGVTFSFTAHAWDIYLSDENELRSKINQAAFAVTCTEFNKKHLHNLCQESKDKVYKNYHGMDVEFFTMREDKKRDENIIFAVGRLVEQKGFKYLIQACKELKDRNVAFKCIIVGGGPLQEEFDALIKELNLSDVISIKGKVTQATIKGYFDQASVFAMPCVIATNGDRDGIPNVLLEALAVGIPIVSTDVSGVPEVIINEQTGLVVPPHDAHALANSLERVLTGKIDMCSCCQKGRTIVEDNFNLDRNVGELVALFQGKGLIN